MKAAELFVFKSCFLLWANINLTDFVIILSLNKNKFDLVIVDCDISLSCSYKVSKIIRINEM